MMDTKTFLTKEEREIIIKSLESAKQKIQDYQHYPSYEFKCRQVAEIESLIVKVKNGVDNGLS